MSIFFGLLTALGWGAADLLVRYATNLLGTYRSLLFMQFIGLFGLSVYLLITGELFYLIAHKSWIVWTWAIGATLLTMLSSLALYRAFEVGTVMVVSPITASYAAITSALAFLSGEQASALHIMGMAVVLIGVVLVATPIGNTRAIKDMPHSRGGLPRGVLWAIVASLGYGVSFWMLGFFVIPELGGIVPTWLSRTITPCILLMAAPLVGQSIRLPRGRAWWYVAGVGVIDTIAFISYTFGLRGGQIALVSVLSSLYSAITVILAWLLLREQLQRSQLLGVGVVLAGIILVNL